MLERFNLRRDVDAAIEWLGLFSEALRDRPDGIFAAEMRTWFTERGETINGKLPGKGDLEADRMLNDALAQSVNAFQTWGLLRSELNFPDRVYPNARFQLHREHQVWLTGRGATVATWPTWRRRLFIAPRVLFLYLKPKLVRLRTPFAVFSFCLALFKMFSTLNNLRATAAAFAVAALAATISLAHSHHH